MIEKNSYTVLIVYNNKVLIMASNKEEEYCEGDEEEYVEAEPVLAYSRMKNDINKILQNDSVSCIKADHKVKF